KLKAMEARRLGDEAAYAKVTWMCILCYCGNPQFELQDKGVIDSRCSRDMTRNMSYLSEYEEINGGYVAFGGDPKRGKITGKGKISTGKLDFKDVYFVKELTSDSFCFEIEPNQERLIDLMKNDISDNSSNDPLLEEVDLFLSDNSIPPSIENFANDPEGDIRFLEELLIDDSIRSHELSDSNFEDNPSIPRPPLEPPDAKTDAGEEIAVVMNDKDKFDDDS
nr:hypothetical protein [Tanacetum cinerariifolium]